MNLVGIILGILTFAMVLVSIFLILLVLMQKTSDGGLGSAMGGGMAEATFGANTDSVLSKATINTSIAFFVLGLALYLGRIWEKKHTASNSAALPVLAVPASSPTLPALPALPPASAPAKQ